MPTINDDFISINLHNMEGSSIRDNIFKLNLIEFRINFYEGTIKLTSWFPPEDVDVLTDTTHSMPFNPLIWDIFMTFDIFPPEYFSINILFTLIICIFYLFFLSCFHSDDLLIDNYIVIECSIQIYNGRIFLIY